VWKAVKTSFCSVLELRTAKIGPNGGAAIHQKLRAGWFVLDGVKNIVYEGNIKRTSASIRMQKVF